MILTMQNMIKYNEFFRFENLVKDLKPILLKLSYLPMKLKVIVLLRFHIK